MAEKTYELKDQQTSFYDDETGLTVTRDERVKIGEDVGRKTMLMIQHGGLVEVKGAASPPTGSGPMGTENADILPPDFPGKEKLEAANYSTLGAVLALSDAELAKVAGKANAEKIRELVK
jgi:hypothetical protein